jgi:restriction system protein
LEQYVAELFEQLGYQASLTKLVGDHGIDVQLVNKQGLKEVVQCKQWANRNKGLVGEPELRDFYGAMMAENAFFGYMVAPHGFTQEAIRWATGKPLALADANWLFLKASELGLWTNEELTETPATHPASSPPQCPRCGSETVVRVAKRGPNVGARFYGCSRYPKCSAFILINDG